MNFTYTKSQFFKRTVWEVRNANFNIFRPELSKINWEFIDIIDYISTIGDTFTSKFIEVAKSTIPNKECIVSGKDKPWMHNEIRKHIRIRRRIHKIPKRVNTSEEWRKYRVQRNKVIALVRKRFADNLTSDTNKSSKF